MTKREWLAVPAMLVGGSVPGVVIGFISMTVWSGILAGVLFVPFSFAAGALVVARDV